jgi:hypothetical protein
MTNSMVKVSEIYNRCHIAKSRIIFFCILNEDMEEKGEENETCSERRNDEEGEKKLPSSSRGGESRRREKRKIPGSMSIVDEEKVIKGVREKMLRNKIRREERRTTREGEGPNMLGRRS